MYKISPHFLRSITQKIDRLQLGILDQLTRRSLEASNLRTSYHLFVDCHM